MSLDTSIDEYVGKNKMMKMFDSLMKKKTTPLKT